MNINELRQKYRDKILDSYFAMEKKWLSQPPHAIVSMSREIEMTKLLKNILLNSVGPNLASHLIEYGDPLQHCCTQWKALYGSLDTKQMKEHVWQLAGLVREPSEDLQWPGFKMMETEKAPERLGEIFRAKLVNINSGESIWLSFPASHENYKECMHILGLGVNDINAVRADRVIVTNEHLPNVIPALNSNPNLNELNLAAYMLAVDNVYLYQIEALLTSTHAPSNTADLINALYNLDDYELVSAETYEELAIMAADEWDLADRNEPGFDATTYGHEVSAGMDAALSKHGFVFHTQISDTAYFGNPDEVLNSDWLLAPSQGPQQDVSWAEQEQDM